MATRKTTTPIRKAKASMNTEQMSEHANDAANLLRAMASEHRLMVLCSLVPGEKSVSQLLGRVPLAQSALSQHLAVLRRERLVSTRRDGQTVYYGLNPGPAMSVIRVLYDNYCCNPD
jgi:DNA-binding transcriptional ArsR family regulator